MKLFKLKEFSQKEMNKPTSGDGQASFLGNFTHGQLEIFHDMMDKMIQSKSAEIYKLFKENQSDPYSKPESSYEGSDDS